MKKDDCYESIRVYDFFDVMHYLDEKYKSDFHDAMFEMIENSDQEGKNDSLHRVYRHWIKNKDIQTLFDAICKEFEIEHKYQEYGAIKNDTTKIVFWVSW